MLGLGCMRFPRNKIEAEKIILDAIKGGVNLFDTAYLYPGSETTLGGVLSKHNKRNAVYISTKLPLSLCRKYEDFDKYFNEQLKRLQTDYIDYYFLHNITSFKQWERLRKLGIEKWIASKKDSGQISQIGFSFHGAAGEFIEVINSYDFEFCLIQYNYYEPNYQAGQAGMMAAAEKNMTIMIMEPLLGGQLATGLPKNAVEIFKNTRSDLSPADWALWWLWSQAEVTTVLSGMSSAKIVEKNLNSVKRFSPLTKSERAVCDEVVAIFRKSYKVNCTNCNYCLPCPQGINIPGCLSARNASYAQNLYTGFALYMTSTGVISSHPTSARLCNQCGKCEKACPQNLAIRAELKQVTRRFEFWPIPWILAIVRRFIAR